VEGDILASKELVLGRTANVRGHLAAPALVVEEGAQLNGSCRRIDAKTADSIAHGR
jgi:cytoskeletal protein CcmA (bactofilin family)